MSAGPLPGMSTSPAYTVDEVLGNFAALLDSFDFTPEIDAMGIGRMQFLRRKRALQDLRALFIALWRLALRRSFPNDHEVIFETFLERFQQAPARNADRREAAALTEKVRGYVGMLEHKGDADFSEAAHHLVSLLSLGDAEAKALRLRLALHIRSTYKLIFDKLI
ncbi:hypothetical protein [Nitratidesulfovibrio sp.]|uniref:hypothetical protein n=1 Tax=Nitratidesulfovibrio sp. TaxID=2802297 RepID=UPI00333E308E